MGVSSFISNLCASRGKPPQGPPPKYVLERRILGHAGPVFALAASSTGNVLASGGEDGIRLFDLKDKFEFTLPHQNSVSLRQVSAICWITGRNDPWETICFGTGLGWLTFWRQNARLSCFEELAFRRVGDGHEISCIAYDQAPVGTFRVSLGFRDQIVQVWTLDASSNLNSLFSIRLDDTIPKAIAFYGPSDEKFEPRKVLVLGYVDGKMIRLHEKTGAVLSTKEFTLRVGNAIFSEELNTCVIDNTDDGFDIHQLDSGTFVRSLKCPPSKRSFPRQVAFGENGNVVICGSNDGSAYVFDRRGGELVASLSHSASGRCQTVTGFTRNGTNYIATASSDDSDGVRIHIWKSTASARSEEKRDDGKPRTASQNHGWSFSWVALVVALILALLFYYTVKRCQFGWFTMQSHELHSLAWSFNKTYSQSIREKAILIE